MKFLIRVDRDQWRPRLSVMAIGATVCIARECVYEAVRVLSFPGNVFRTDSGAEAQELEDYGAHDV